jgi:putative ubiquitin-RnfH superfamily antitoxin RatB of RatAB toxin-antitoxin module
MKRCTVVFALPAKQWLWDLELAEGATVADALEAARVAAGDVAVPWEGAVGIFGALCDRDAVPRDGDRIEIYRPLRADPKASRRARARSSAAAQGRAGPAPPPRRSS